MFDDPRAFSGAVTFISGYGKDCGKTSFMNHALGVMRRSGPEPCAFMTVGFDGEGRDSFTGSRKPEVTAFPGDVTVTAERFLRRSEAAFECLDVLRGSTPFGPLAVARARRKGTVTLVGPEGNQAVTDAVSALRLPGRAGTVFVDGAINRITQVSSFPGSSFVFVLKADAAGLRKCAARVRLLRFLSALPVAENAGGADVFAVDGALTREVASGIPADGRKVAIDDLTKSFLDERELVSLSRNRDGTERLFVRRGMRLAGFVVILRGVSREAFLDAAGTDAAGLVSFNPHEREFPSASGF